MLLISCANEQEHETRKIQSTGFASANKITLSVQSTMQLEDDINNPLGQIAYYESISSDSAIIVAKSQILLFVDNKFTKIIAHRGKGPREYRDTKSLSIKGDTIVIWDDPTKLLFYSLKQDSVIDETTTSLLYGARAIAYLPQHQLYYSTMPRTESKDNQDTMIFCINHTHTHKPTKISIPITQKQLEFPNLQNPFIQPFSSLKRNGEYVIFRFILSPYLVLFNYLKNEFTLFKLQVNIKNVEKRSEANDSEIFAKSDFVENVFPLKKKFAVLVFKPSNQPQKKDMFLQFYSYEGQSLTEIKIDAKKYAYQPLVVVNVTEDTIEILGLNRAVNAQYPYGIIKQQYTFAK
jgi:hypothetical protein